MNRYWWLTLLCFVIGGAPAGAAEREIAPAVRALSALPPASLLTAQWNNDPQWSPDGKRFIYASHLGALNIRHEHNVINGLNQRHFAPYIVGTPVIADAQGDIEQCFDPGHEILVYRDAAELSAIQTMLRANPTKARDVGEAGHKRVMAQHTYAHRIETVAALAGVRKFR